MIADAAWWIGALVLCAAPRRVWNRVDPRFPLERCATTAGVLTAGVGVLFGLDRLLRFGGALASASNTWMLEHAASDPGAPAAVYGLSIATFFIFLVTPAGLLALYLVASGTGRAMCAIVDDPRGDPLLSLADQAMSTLWARHRAERGRIARERLEGDDAPDVVRTGAWAGLQGVDYVVLAARRKPEWNAGAIVMTATDWFKLGVPFDMNTPAGLRTVYPLTRMETVEVVRRGIQYELPGQTKSPAGSLRRG